MNKKQKLAVSLMIATTLAAPVVMTSAAFNQPVVVAHADTTTDQGQQTSTLTKAYVVYGAGAPESAYANLNDVMDVDSSFTKLTATGQDYATYIKELGTNYEL